MSPKINGILESSTSLFTACLRPREKPSLATAPALSDKLTPPDQYRGGRRRRRWQSLL